MRTHTRHTRSTGGAARLLLTTVVAALALLAGGAAAASAAPAQTEKATSKCWLDVVNDWLNNNRVDGTYPTACYTQAIQQLNSYPDIQQYSSAMDDIHRALLASYHDRDSGSGGGGSSGSSGGGGAAGGGSGGGGGDSGGAAAPTHQSFITRLFHAVGPGDAQAVPLPLLVLAGLAVLLLLAAGGTWVAKRLQTRRMTPATATARTADERR